MGRRSRPDCGEFAALLVRVLVGLAVTACGGPERGEPRALRVGEDLLASGGQVVLRDAVAGDVMLAAGSVEFTGSSGGDLLAAAGEQTIGGSIEGSVRAAAGRIAVLGVGAVLALLRERRARREGTVGVP
jgi:hypothetical protein